MKITKILYGAGLCLLFGLTVSLSAFSTADQTDLARIIVKSLSRYEQLKEVTPKTKEVMDSWLPNLGVRSKYAILKSIAGMDILESATGIKVFREGPHQGQINYYSNTMGYYNPEFLNEVNRTLKTLFEDPEFKEDAKVLYERHFQKLLKTYYAAYQNLHLKFGSPSGELTRLKEDYLEKTGSDNLPGEFLQEYFRRISDRMKGQGFDWYESDTALGFWLRRNIDGTDIQFLDLLKMVFNNLETIIENDTLHVRELEDRDGLKYQIGVDKPFTGVAINRQPNGVKIYQANYVKGERREFTVWNRQGTKVEEVRFEDGVGYKMTWDYVGNLKVEQDHILNGNTWEMISHTNYSLDGHKIMRKVYENKQEVRETHWYSDGSKMEEKSYENEQRVWKIWDHNGSEIIRGEMPLPDTVDMEEIEWKGPLSAYKKGSDKPFTGVIKFSGELDYRYRKGVWWRVRENPFHSTATIVFGKFNGPYTLWYEENGLKRSERNLKSEMRDGITQVGTYTQWYNNGQKEFEQRSSGDETRWYKNGQKASEESKNGYRRWYENGQLKDKVDLGASGTSNRTRWYENGEKQSESLVFRGSIVRAKVWDADGNVIDDVQPVKDEDKNKIRSFAENFVYILKKQNYKQLEDLFLPFEKLLETYISEEEVTEEEIKRKSEEIKRKSIEYDEDKLEYIRNFKDTEEFYELGKIELVRYNFWILDKDRSRKTIEWPNSINYVPEAQAKYYTAQIQIILYKNNKLDQILLNLLFANNQWYIVPEAW